MEQKSTGKSNEVLLDEYDVVILDPTSPDLSRASFCYLPYLLYIALKEEGRSVLLYENFTAMQMDSLPKAKSYMIAFWSPCQRELCHVLKEHLPSKNIEFFGYFPYINKEGFPLYIVPDSDIEIGMKMHPKYYSHFYSAALCDCGHLIEYGEDVYPLFTSYGCPSSCAFCSTCINCNHTRLELSLDEVKEQLQRVIESGARSIHFTDEDFFWNVERAFDILTYMAEEGLNLNCIALGSVRKVQQFVDAYGEDIFKEAGLNLLEIGFETADESVSKKMKKVGASHCEKLAKDIKNTKILWLTMSFFAGETITSLNLTGEFLNKYGLKYDDLYDRIKGNGTRGGLGQYFMPYTGTKGIDNLEDEGITLFQNPMRIVPSFIPNSFLDAVIEKVNPVHDRDKKWFEFYGLEYDSYPIVKNCSIRDQVEDPKDYKAYQFYAICAKVGIIQ